MDPPIVEGSIWSDVEALFWGRGFSKGIGYVGAEDKEVFRCSDSIEEAGTRLVDTNSIRFGQDTYHTGACGAIADTSCLFAAVHCLYGVGPDEMKDGIIIFGGDWLPEHALRVVLVELEIFQLLPG